MRDSSQLLQTMSIFLTPSVVWLQSPKELQAVGWRLAAYEQ